jgi:hypothetical protein
LDVVLISAYEHIGGILTNGLGVMDRLYTGRRAPIFDEIVDYYRQTYGANSQQLKDYVDTRLTFEPHIAELVLNKLVDNTQNLTALKPYFPTAIKRDGNRINEVQIQSRGGEVTRHDIKAETYIDATYEGNLAALAGVAYSAGRESRWEFDEPHAGRIFTTHDFM